MSDEPPTVAVSGADPADRSSPLEGTEDVGRRSARDSSDPTLAAVALGLGVAALIVALIPYLVWIALPIAVVAVVLGALSWSGVGRVHAIVGTVTGGVAIIVVLAWVALLAAGWSPLPLAGLPDLTAREMGAEIGVEVQGREPVDDGEVAGAGTAMVELDGTPTAFELDDCFVSVEAGELHAQAVGAQGSVVLRVTGQDVALTTVTGPEQAQRILRGTPDRVGLEQAEGWVRLDGTLIDLGSGEEIAIRLTVECD